MNNARQDKENGTATVLSAFVVVPVLYIATGKLALLLAVPPGYASPLWLPAGIAAAALLLGGLRLWPAVFTGAMLLNLWASLDTRFGMGATTLPVAVAVATGATLQAVLAAWIARYVQWGVHAFESARRVSAFLFLVGPLACLCSATVGVLTLRAAGFISWQELSFNWWAWWVGDTIGVIVVVPLAIIWAGRAGRLWYARRLQVALPILLSVALVLGSFVTTTRHERDNLESQFRVTAPDVA